MIYWYKLTNIRLIRAPYIGTCFLKTSSNLLLWLRMMSKVILNQNGSKFNQMRIRNSIIRKIVLIWILNVIWIILIIFIIHLRKSNRILKMLTIFWNGDRNGSNIWARVPNLLGKSNFVKKWINVNVLSNRIYLDNEITIFFNLEKTAIFLDLCLPKKKKCTISTKKYFTLS